MKLRVIHWCLAEPFKTIHSFKHKFYFSNLVAFSNDIQHLIFLPIFPLFFVSVLFLNFMHTTLRLFSILLYFVLHEIVRGCIGRILSSHVPLKEVRNIFALSWILEKRSPSMSSNIIRWKILFVYLSQRKPLLLLLFVWIP